jgi:HEAT repeat protein
MKNFMMDKDYNIDLLKVIADFLELGHLENIVAMFKQDTSLYNLTGKLVRDERFAVRLGLAVLFEELAVVRPNDLPYAIPSLLPLLQEENPLLRGEAATILGIIGTRAALQLLLPLRDDPDPQVREIITDIISPENERY